MARRIYSSSRPEHPIFDSLPLRYLNPILSEWIMMPFRLVTRMLKDVKGRYFGWDYRRRL